MEVTAREAGDQVRSSPHGQCRMLIEVCKVPYQIGKEAFVSQVLNHFWNLSAVEEVSSDFAAALALIRPRSAAA